MCRSDVPWFHVTFNAYSLCLVCVKGLFVVIVIYFYLCLQEINQNGNAEGCAEIDAEGDDLQIHRRSVGRDHWLEHQDNEIKSGNSD